MNDQIEKLAATYKAAARLERSSRTDVAERARVRAEQIMLEAFAFGQPAFKLFVRLINY